MSQCESDPTPATWPWPGGVSASALYDAVALSIKCICLCNTSPFSALSLSGPACSRNWTRGGHQLLSRGAHHYPTHFPRGVSELGGKKHEEWGGGVRGAELGENEIIAYSALECEKVKVDTYKSKTFKIYYQKVCAPECQITKTGR